MKDKLIRFDPWFHTKFKIYCTEIGISMKEMATDIISNFMENFEPIKIKEVGTENFENVISTDEYSFVMLKKRIANLSNIKLNKKNYSRIKKQIDKINNLVKFFRTKNEPRSVSINSFS